FERAVRLMALREILLQILFKDLTLPGMLNVFAGGFADGSMLYGMSSDPNKSPKDPNNLGPDDIHYDPKTGEWVVNGPTNDDPSTWVNIWGGNPLLNPFNSIQNIDEKKYPMISVNQPPNRFPKGTFTLKPTWDFKSIKFGQTMQFNACMDEKYHTY